MLTAKDIFVVGVAGGSGSGKTTLTENLVQRFSDHICVVHHDNYYKPHDDLPFEVRTKLNYDCPDAFETPLLAQQLRQLRQGQPVDCPTYDYANHTRAKGTVRLVPQPVILLEGILIFAEPEPSKGNADIIIPHGGRNSVALDLIIGRIERHLRECGR